MKKALNHYALLIIILGFIITITSCKHTPQKKEIVKNHKNLTKPKNNAAHQSLS